MKRWLSIFAIMAAMLVSVQAQSSSGKTGVIFKIPDGVFPIDWNKNGFIGFLMLEKDSPSGLFVAYPNNGGETIESLRERIAKFVVPMFAHEEKEKKEFDFKKTSIPNHKGDLEDSDVYYLYENEKSMVQILFYERKGDVKNALYGYFSKKEKDAGGKKSSSWADEKGQGVKILEKFSKSFN